MKTVKMLVAMLILTAIFISNSIAQVKPTNEWVNFYGTNTLFQNVPVPVGAQINAYDPKGVLCGSFTVDSAGEYGFMLVYRDDALTTTVDEGAVPGDTIRFTINAKTVKVQNPGSNLWTSNGAIVRVELTTNLAPTVLHRISDIQLQEDTPLVDIADLDSVFIDPEKNILTYTVQSNLQQIQVSLDSGNRVNILLAANWNGQGQIIFSASDGFLSVKDTVNISVKPVNDSPQRVHSINDITLLEDSPPYITTDLDTIFTDIDNPTLTYSIQSSPEQIHMNLDSQNRMTMLLDRNWAGTGQLIVTASDGFLSAKDTINVTVNQINDAPMIKSIPDTFMTNPGILILDLKKYGTDLEDAAETLKWAVSFITDKKDSIKTIIDDNNIATLSISYNFVGSFSIIFTVTDLGALSASDTVKVRVQYPTGLDLISKLEIPNDLVLSHNYPNPFNIETNIIIGLPKATEIKILIYNIKGQEVRRLAEQFYQAGWHVLQWNGMDESGQPVGSGTYLISLYYQNYLKMKKMQLTK